MSKSDALENDLLELLFKGVAIADLAENDTTSPNTTLYVSLHTADPTDAGTRSSSETAYTGYARVGVTRGAGWTVTGNSCSPAANIDFGECTASPGGAITHFGVGTASAGTGYLMYSGTVTSNITMTVGTIPRIKSTSTIVED